MVHFPWLTVRWPEGYYWMFFSTRMTNWSWVVGARWIRVPWMASQREAGLFDRWVGKPGDVDGHFRNRFIGGTYHIKAHSWGLCKGISPQNMANNMVLTYLHLLDPEDLPLMILGGGQVFPQVQLASWPLWVVASGKARWNFTKKVIDLNARFSSHVWLPEGISLQLGYLTWVLHLFLDGYYMLLPTYNARDGPPSSNLVSLPSFPWCSPWKTSLGHVILRVWSS